MSPHESGSYEAPALAAGALGFLPESMFGMDTLEETWADFLEGDASVYDLMRARRQLDVLLRRRSTPVPQNPGPQ